MLKPSIDELITKTNSNYALAMATAKRARKIIDGEPILVKTKSERPVTIAVEEFYAGEFIIE